MKVMVEKVKIKAKRRVSSGAIYRREELLARPCGSCPLSAAGHERQ